MRIRSIIVVVIALAFLIPSAALTQEPVKGGVLRAAMNTNPPTLDPHLSTSTATRQIAYYISEGLLAFNESYQIIPQLAESWEVSKDRLTYTFHLRDDVVFHNGKTLSAADVVASIERYIAVSPGAAQFDAVVSVEEINDLTVVIHQDRPSLLEVSLALPNPALTIFPAEIIKDHKAELRGPDELVGTGPYKLVEWTPDVWIKLERFEDYSVDKRFEEASGLGGRRIAYFDEVLLVPVTEEASRLAGLETGDYDFAEGMPLTSFDRISSDANLIPYVVKPKWMPIIEFNKTLWPMNDVRFRKAIAAALDVDEIMRAVTFGNPSFYRLEPCLLQPEESTWFNTNGEEVYYGQDVERAKALLKEIGYNNEPITYITNRDFSWMYKASLAAASQLQQAGINIQLEFMDWPSQRQRALSMEGWHINQNGWSARLDPIMITRNFSSGSAISYGYESDTMDDLMQQISLSLPVAERQQAFYEVMNLVWDELPVIKFGDYFELDAASSKLHGYSPFYVIPRFWNCWKEQ
jgi:peptide/nickel transport system substrate-binding protein